MRKKINTRITALIYGCISIGSFLILWWFLSDFTSVKNTTPAPDKVVTLLLTSFTKPIGEYTIIGHLLVSMRRVLVGFTAATVLGIILGIAMGTSRYAEAIFKPIFELLRPIPPIAWLSMVILFFGIGEMAKYVICSISAFTNVTLNAYMASKSVDPELVGCAKMLGTSKRGVFFRVILPSCTPQIFAGMQVALSTAWMAVLAAEMVGAREGCGWMIQRGSDTLNITLVLVGMIVIGTVGFILETFMRKIERKLCSWNVMGE